MKRKKQEETLNRWRRRHKGEEKREKVGEDPACATNKRKLPLPRLDSHILFDIFNFSFKKTKFNIDK